MNTTQQLLLFAPLSDKVFEGFIVAADSHVNRITELQFTVIFTYNNAKKKIKKKSSEVLG